MTKQERKELHFCNGHIQPLEQCQNPRALHFMTLVHESLRDTTDQ
jgi:hypothetical protein